MGSGWVLKCILELRIDGEGRESHWVRAWAGSWGVRAGGSPGEGRVSAYALMGRYRAVRGEGLTPLLRLWEGQCPAVGASRDRPGVCGWVGGLRKT